VEQGGEVGRGRVGSFREEKGKGKGKKRGRKVRRGKVDGKGGVGGVGEVKKGVGWVVGRRGGVEKGKGR